MKQQESPDLITRREACETLRCHPATLRRWEISGRIQPIKISAIKVLYRRADLMRILEQATLVTATSK